MEDRQIKMADRLSGHGGDSGGIGGMRWMLASLAGVASFLTVWLLCQYVFGMEPGTAQALGGGALAVALLPLGAWAARRGGVDKTKLRAKALTAASAGVGVMDLFVVTGSGGLLAASCQEAGRWSGWSNLHPVGSVTDVAAAVTATDRTEVFYVDSNGDVWWGVVGKGVRPHWSRVPHNPGVGRVVAVSAHSMTMGHREIYVVGAHGRTSHIWHWDHKEWPSSWHAGKPTPACRDVAVSVPRDGLMECWAVGVDGIVRNRWYPKADDVDGWSNWADGFGRGLTSSAVAADVVNAWPDHQELFVVRADGGISHRDHWQGKDWPAWRDLEAPAVIRNIGAGVTSKGHIEVVAVDEDGSLWQKSFADGLGWGMWRTLNISISE